MSLPKGRTNNPNGRPAGSQNKNSIELRLKINQFLTDKFDDVINEFDNLDSKDKLKFYSYLLQYAIPKMRDLDHRVEHLKTIEV